MWNLFLSSVSGLSQLEYAMLAEVTGRCPFAAEVFNCSAPGTFMGYLLIEDALYRSIWIYKSLFRSIYIYKMCKDRVCV